MNFKERAIFKISAVIWEFWNCYLDDIDQVPRDKEAVKDLITSDESFLKEIRALDDEEMNEHFVSIFLLLNGFFYD